jgi:subfamily B ATP-binding cassette protein MsbA
LVSLLTAKLRASYEKDLKLRAFEKTVNARVEFFDKSGSDTILNIIITQARKGSNVITLIVRLVERIFLITMYLAIALYLAPLLTVLTVFVIGGVTYVVRNVLESGYAAGDRVADADENVQESVQAGTQGIRDVKLFGSENDIFSEFVSHIDYYVRSKVSVQRNKAAINSFYSFLSAATLFSLVYFSFTFTDLTFQDLGLFLITMFRLAPQANSLNNIVYKVETGLPHLTRTENFIAELDDNQESSNHSRQMPVPVT